MGDDDDPWTFRELIPTGWELSSTPSCTTTQGSPWSYGEDGFSVELRADDVVVCTFVNARELTGPLALYKQTVGGVGSFPFTVDVPAPGDDREETAVTTEENSPVLVVDNQADIPGTYTATETLPEVDYGTWELRDAYCNGEEVPVTADGQERTASLPVTAEESVTCLVTNEFTSDGRIEITKETRGGTGTFQYAISPAPDDKTSPPTGVDYQLSATTQAEDTEVSAEPTEESDEPTNLRIGSRWLVHELLPARAQADSTVDALDATRRAIAARDERHRAVRPVQHHRGDPTELMPANQPGAAGAEDDERGVQLVRGRHETLGDRGSESHVVPDLDVQRDGRSGRVQPAARLLGDDRLLPAHRRVGRGERAVLADDEDEIEIGPEGLGQRDGQA